MHFSVVKFLFRIPVLHCYHSLFFLDLRNMVFLAAMKVNLVLLCNAFYLGLLTLALYSGLPRSEQVSLNQIPILFFKIIEHICEIYVIV